MNKNYKGMWTLILIYTKKLINYRINLHGLCKIKKELPIILQRQFFFDILYLKG